jgi:hypothetical protein
MKKSQLKHIIKKVIKEQSTGCPAQAAINAGVQPLNPSHDGCEHHHYVGIICPAKYASFYTGLPIANIDNWTFLNQQYAIAGISPIPPVPNPGSTFGVTQMFTCFQVHPVNESWYGGGAGGAGFHNLPQIQGSYASIQQAVADGWMTPGPINNCQNNCISLAVNYNPNHITIDHQHEDDWATLEPCVPPSGGCPDMQTPSGPVGTIWQGAPYCKCLSPSVGWNPSIDNPPIGIEDPTGLTHQPLDPDCTQFNLIYPPGPFQDRFCAKCHYLYQQGNMTDPLCKCCPEYGSWGPPGTPPKGKREINLKEYIKNYIKENL